MSPRWLRFKRPYAIFIIILMVLGVVAGVYVFYNLSTSGNPCNAPTTPQFSSVYLTTIDGQDYNAVNATFTNTEQNFVFSGVTFLTVSFSDPSLPHLIGSVCGVDNTTAASIQLRVTFSFDGAQESLANVPFKDGIVYPEHTLSQHFSPQAGMYYFPGDSYVVLVVAPSFSQF